MGSEIKIRTEKEVIEVNLAEVDVYGKYLGKYFTLLPAIYLFSKNPQNPKHHQHDPS